MEVNCETEMKKTAISKKVFEKEISLCEKMSRENGGCCWGRCEKCGVVPLLIKLYKGKLIDDKNELKKLKNRFIKK